MEFDISRFRETFFQEVEEHIAAMESGLLQLESNPDAELLNSIFRGAHSIKGASATFGFEDIARFTHALEGLLDGMRAGTTEPSPARINLMLKSLDTLRGLLNAARAGTGLPQETAAITQALLVAQQSGNDRSEDPPPVQSQDGPPACWRIAFVPSREVLRQGLDPVLVLRDLSRLGEVLQVEADLSRLPALAGLQPDLCYLAWNLRLVSQATEPQIRDAFAFAEDGATLEIRREPERGTGSPVSAPIPSRAGTATESGTIRVATGKVDKLIDLVGELMIAQSMASQVLATFGPTDLTRLQESFAEVERYTRELQSRLMGIRMLPIGSAFSRFPRLVRDLAAATGKRVALAVQGEETELDKSVVERMADPLTHLVRNAIDHGIEPPEERIAAGKPAIGAITLRASHQGGSVVLEVSDDGRGLDNQRILAKARERGLVGENESPTGERISALIFEPGFSTAVNVSDISGRGVGMDVVKRSVESLSGAIAIASQPGRGITFRIQLPLTLAILDGLLLRVGGQRFVLPLTSIVESIAPRREQLRQVAGGGEVIVLRGEAIPVVRLSRLFQVASAAEGNAALLAVIVDHRGKRLALLVDELLGQQQVVIKSLETNFRKVEGAAGATILGDGQPALILDVAAVVEMARNCAPTSSVCDLQPISG
jgi:two-component system chemotaxis sensor kinase CheA